MKKIRLDEWLVTNSLVDSRSKAKALILAGKVMQGTNILDKPGQMVLKDSPVRVIESPRFVSRGGEKLEGFIRKFSISMEGYSVLDVGASTGGFTDCCLQNGANHVTCIDVGRAQLNNKLIQDARVINIEKYNARYLKVSDLPHDKYPRIVMDLSFISLKKILPAVWHVLNKNGILIALIKPQFEAERHEVDAGKGIIKSPEIHQRILEDILSFCKNSLAYSEIIGYIDSPIKGTGGNKEFLVGLTKSCIVTTEQ